jgi:hypothetical protein
MRGANIPEDWLPTNLDREYGHRLGLSDSQIDAMAEDMRLWAGANANRQIARKANWSMAFKGWMRRGAQQAENRNANSIGNAAARLARRAEAGEFAFTPRPTRPSLLPNEGEIPVRLLPER